MGPFLVLEVGCDERIDAKKELSKAFVSVDKDEAIIIGYFISS